ncbi:MAG: hypothetical protein DWQ07_10040 [Chloroflexi bacterium]|nr:MAG: hypothetical protein DWQ07_10040 [Chloroflexota bacterium]MBL1192949.1 hypothetical protein [Chloroflexota bacterium]NOH10241.1 hypothetical protein [Chloroflexota bacterium]
MRITPKLLNKIAEDTVAERTAADESILAAYLHGSILSEPLLGGTADVDLFFIYAGEDDSSMQREVVRLTDEVHVDISHHGQAVYAEGRNLRGDPWWGHAIHRAKILYDPQHFLQIIQAGVRGLFESPEFVSQRAEPQLEAARATWFKFYNQSAGEGPQLVTAYLSALENVGNAVACLSGPPLTERRFLLEFPERAEALGSPGLMPGLVGLLGGGEVDQRSLMNWLPDWEDAYNAVSTLDDVPPSLHPHRKHYYAMAFQALLENDEIHALLWPLMHTWTRSVAHLPADSSSLEGWTAACDQLNLLGAHFENKVAALDAYLDLVEELFEDWKAQRGV